MDAGSVTWVMVSAALVIFMTPGLALFYSGMVRAKNALNMLLMNIYCLGVVPLVWVVIGYTLATSGTSPVIGNFDFFGLEGIIVGQDGGQQLLFVFFWAAFAAITPALIAGAVADRMKFIAWVIFIPLWSVLVFSPIWYWIYGRNDAGELIGWLGERGSLDFAGGTVIHVNAGIAALAAVLVLGKRRGWPGEAMPPHSLPLVLAGAGILWFGWFGFNAGSAGAANAQAVQAFMNTLLAASAAMLGWLLVEKIRDNHATTLGAASGIVAGLVAITPAAGYVGGMAGMAIGFIAGVICAFAVSAKFKFGFDDSLDVVGIHFVGGLTGSLLIGLFADPSGFGELGTFDAGLFFGGGWGLLGEQALANLAAMAWSFVLTFAILKVLDAFIGIRVSEDEEKQGLDTTLHIETAYNFGELSSSGRSV